MKKTTIIVTAAIAAIGTCCSFSIAEKAPTASIVYASDVPEAYSQMLTSLQDEATTQKLGNAATSIKALPGIVAAAAVVVRATTVYTPAAGQVLRTASFPQTFIGGRAMQNSKEGLANYYENKAAYDVYKLD